MLEICKVFRIALLVCSPVTDDTQLPRAAVRLLLAQMHRVHGGDKIVLQAHREKVQPVEFSGYLINNKNLLVLIILVSRERYVSYYVDSGSARLTRAKCTSHAARTDWGHSPLTRLLHLPFLPSRLDC